MGIDLIIYALDQMGVTFDPFWAWVILLVGGLLLIGGLIVGFFSIIRATRRRHSDAGGIHIEQAHPVSSPIASQNFGTVIQGNNNVVTSRLLDDATATIQALQKKVLGKRLAEVFLAMQSQIAQERDQGEFVREVAKFYGIEVDQSRDGPAHEVLYTLANLGVLELKNPGDIMRPYVRSVYPTKLGREVLRNLM